MSFWPDAIIFGHSYGHRVTLGLTLGKTPRIHLLVTLSLAVTGGAPSTVKNLRSEIRNKSANTPETLSEQILDFLPSVRLEVPKDVQSISRIARCLFTDQPEPVINVPAVLRAFPNCKSKGQEFSGFVQLQIDPKTMENEAYSVPQKSVRIALPPVRLAQFPFLEVSPP